MSVPYRCVAGTSPNERGVTAFHGVIWGQYANFVGRCGCQHEQEADAVACAEQKAAALPEQKPLDRKALLIIRVDGQIDDGPFIDEMAPSFTRWQADNEDTRIYDEMHP
jgi:hypothetical protein